MDKSKRQVLKEIKKRKLKEIAKTAVRKLAAVWVISSMIVVNVPTGFTMAAFVDQEASRNNTISAGTLDAGMTALADFDPAVKPTINATKDIDLSSLGTLGFKYNIKSSNLIGDLCSSLNLKADLDGANQYNGPIENFDVDIAEISAPEKWHFEASMETEDYSLQGKNCTLDFLVAAKQKDLVGGVGFSDDETMANVINAGTWILKGVWIQTTVDDFNAGISSDSGWPSYRKEINVSYPGDASLAAGQEIPPQVAGFSGSSDGNHLPPFAIDGNDTTYWHSIQANNGDYFWVDLGQLYPIAKTKIHFAKNPPKDYKIIINTTFSTTSGAVTVADVKGNTSDRIEHSFTEAMVRYIFILMPKMNGNPAIYEFEVFKRELPWFDGSATLTSQTFDSAKITKWTKLEWDETLVPGTNINFAVETSNDGSNWGSWQLKSGTSPIDLSSLPQTRYIRWQSELTSNTYFPPISTPVLHEARVYYEQENAQNNIVMNEFLPNPDGSTWGSDTDPKPRGEWIELYNKGTSKIDVAGFYFENSASSRRTISSARTNTGSTIIAPNDWLVVYTGQSGSPEFFNNAGDTIKFYDLFGNLLDQYSYDLTNACNLTPTPDNPNTTIPSGSCTSVPANKSYARIPDGIGTWVDPIPTPGTANVEEETFLEELTETLTSTLSILEQVAGESTTTPITEEIATTTQTTESIVEEITTTTTEEAITTESIIEEATTTTQEASTNTETTMPAEPAPEKTASPEPIIVEEQPADMPEEQPATIEEAPGPEEPAIVPETTASTQNSGEATSASETPII